MTWSSAQYVKFEQERNRPIHDLLAQIKHMRVLTAADIGCGPGNSTELLLAQFPDADVIGMDSSPNMIEAARARLPDVSFEVDEIATWQAKGLFDVILANASLQWVPDHASLLPKLLGKLSAQGTLAVQVPDNFEEPAHQLMREVADDSRWAAKLHDAPRALDSRHSADWYYRVLRQSGATVDIWRTVYHHPLAQGASAIVEWFKSTGLRPFLEPLNDLEKAEFLVRYEAAVAAAYPAQPDGSVLLPFHRLFFIATRR